MVRYFDQYVAPVVDKIIDTDFVLPKERNLQKPLVSKSSVKGQRRGNLDKTAQLPQVVYLCDDSS